MVWGVTSGYGAGQLVRIQGNQKPGKYCEILETHLVPWVPDIFGEQESWKFQKGNVPCHVSRYFWKWLAEHGV